jgi:PST family polysaccharide transporter
MNNKNLTFKTLHGLAWSGGTLAVQFALNVASVAILARILSPHDYGVMAAANIVTSFGLMLASLGLTPALIQRSEVNREHIATSLFLSVALAVLLGIAQWLAAPLMATLLQVPELEEVVRVLSFALVAQGLIAFFEALLARALKFKALGVVSLFLWTTTTFFIAIPLAYAGANYWALVVAQLALTFFTAVAYGYFARHDMTMPKFHLLATKELLSVGVGFAITRFFTYVSGYADNIVVGRALGAGDLGIYTRVFYLISVPAQIFGNMSRTVVFPTMSKIQNDHARLKQAYLKGLSLTALTTIPTSAFLVTFAHELVDLVLGNRWAAAITPFAIFSLAIYFRVGAKTCSIVLLAQGRSYSLASLQVVNALLITAGALAAAPYGLNAVCSAVLAAVVVSFCVYAIICGRAAGVRLLDFAEPHLRPLIIGAFVFMVAKMVDVALEDSAAYTRMGVAIIAFGLPLLTILYIKASLILGRHGLEAIVPMVAQHAAKIGWRMH